MEFKFDKDQVEEDALRGKDKGRQTILLVVLLIVMGGFAYIYFFTEMIRPQDKPASPQQVKQPVAEVVKKPMPLKDPAPQPVQGGAAKPTVKVAEAPRMPLPPMSSQPASGAAPLPAGSAAKLDEKKPVTPPAVKPAEPKPAPAPAAKPEPPKQPAVVPKQAAKPVEPKPAPAPAAKPEPPKQVAAVPKQAAKPAEPKPAPAPAAKPEPPKQAAAVPKQAAKPAEPKPAPVPVAKAPEKKPASVVKSKGPWTLVVGNYVVEETLAADMARVKAAGLNPIITSGVRRSTIMHRLLYGEYQDADSAKKAVEELRSQTSGAFSLQRGNSYEVFAGSFSVSERAKEEQGRLASAGVKVTVRNSTVMIPSRKLTAGIYTDRSVAEAALKKLKKASIGSPVLE